MGCAIHASGPQQTAWLGQYARKDKLGRDDRQGTKPQSALKSNSLGEGLDEQAESAPKERGGYR